MFVADFTPRLLWRACSFFSKAPAAPKPTAENEEPKSDGKNEGALAAWAGVSGCYCKVSIQSRVVQRNRHNAEAPRVELLKPCLLLTWCTLCQGKRLPTSPLARARRLSLRLPRIAVASLRHAVWPFASRFDARLQQLSTQPGFGALTLVASTHPQVFSKSGDSAAEPVKEPAGGPAADKGAEESSPKPAPEEAPAPMETDTPDEDVGKTRKPLPEGCLGAGDVGRRIKARASGPAPSAVSSWVPA